MAAPVGLPQDSADPLRKKARRELGAAAWYLKPLTSPLPVDNPLIEVKGISQQARYTTGYAMRRVKLKGRLCVGFAA
jgi:hypothetical protein